MMACPTIARSRSEKNGPYLLKVEVLKSRGTTTLVAVANPVDKPKAMSKCRASRRVRADAVR
jgi:hypothetical protein